jgi:glycosyltransferase involved in cell wall biosynthesis
MSAVRPGARLVIVGEGPDEPALRTLAHECGVAERVEFTGALSPAGVRERMWQANAFVLASAFETFGVVLVEALATGIPIISTRSGGAEDIVEPDCGVLVDQDDDAGLGDAMVAVASGSFSEQRLRDRARDRFSFEKVTEDLLAVYRRLLRSDRMAARSSVNSLS